VAAKKTKPKPKPATGPQKGIVASPTLPPPPPGTYDPALDYQKAASQRGYEQTLNDAATQYQLGQEQYGLGASNLLTGLNRSLADLSTAKGDVHHQYGVLADQQTQGARHQGITSAGLLLMSAQRRAANEAHDIKPLDIAEQRANEDYTSQKKSLDLGNAYTFGGYGGNVMNDPITGQPVVGSLATQTARAGVENQAYQGGLLNQMVYGAQQGGYVSPLLQAVSPASMQAKLNAAAKAKAATSSSGGLPPHFSGLGWW
jgi:hypothetical protein